jgi:hypothetical protein
MIGGIEPRTFKNDADGLVDFAQALLGAFWATSERLISKLLLTVKLDPAIFTSIRINWHNSIHLDPIFLTIIMYPIKHYSAL